MGRIWALVLLLGLISAPVFAQNVYIKGDSQAAKQAKALLEKYTTYKLSDHAAHPVLVVDQIGWSPDFESPATTAVKRTLTSPRGKILWRKTEPVGSRPAEAVIQDLLKDLAKAQPPIR